MEAFDKCLTEIKDIQWNLEDPLLKNMKALLDSQKSTLLETKQKINQNLDRRRIVVG